MNQIKNLKLSALVKPRFVKTQLISYEQEGVPKQWEMAQVHDSVAILIYHKGEDSFIVVKQFRPPVYLNNKDGFTHELCAGICDKELSLAEIASEEIAEETGYAVEAKALIPITSFYTAVGFAGSKQTLFYAQVDETDHLGEGGGVEEEMIEVVKIPRTQAYQFLLDETIAKTPGLMFSFMWWFKEYD